MNAFARAVVRRRFGYLQVGEIRPQLVRRELALVNDDGVRQRAHVEPAARLGYGVRGTFAEREHAAPEVVLVERVRGVHHERLADERLAAPGPLADLAVAHRHRSPAQHLQISQ